MRLRFDFDGTLVSRTTDYRDAEPYPERIAELQRLHDQGHYIIIDTARGSHSTGNYEGLTRNQCHRFGIPYDELRVGEKPYAEIYVGDEAEHADRFFTGPAEVEG